jgi:hypothetical protein
VSFMLLNNIYSTGVTYNCQNILVVQATGEVIDIEISWNGVPYLDSG